MGKNAAVCSILNRRTIEPRVEEGAIVSEESVEDGVIRRLPDKEHRVVPIRGDQ